MPNDLSRNCLAAHARGLRFPSEAGAEAETEKTKQPNNSTDRVKSFWKALPFLGHRSYGDPINASV